MFHKLKKALKSDKTSKSEESKPTDKLEKTKENFNLDLQKKSKKSGQKQTFETLVVSEETVELFEHRITHWEDNVIVSDIRKLMARPSEGETHQKIVTTEKITIPEQTLVVPIKVNKQIGGKPHDSSIVGIPVKIEQMDVPIIETFEVIDVPVKTFKRTTQMVSHSNDKNGDQKGVNDSLES